MIHDPTPPFCMTALALATAAVVALIAWSGDRAIIVDQSAQLATAEDVPTTYNRFIATYRDLPRLPHAP